MNKNDKETISTVDGAVNATSRVDSTAVVLSQSSASTEPEPMLRLLSGMVPADCSDGLVQYAPPPRPSPISRIRLPERVLRPRAIPPRWAARSKFSDAKYGSDEIGKCGMQRNKKASDPHYPIPE